MKTLLYWSLGIMFSPFVLLGILSALCYAGFMGGFSLAANGVTDLNEWMDRQ